MALRMPENLLVLTPKYEITLEVAPADEKKKVLLRTSPPVELTSIENAADLNLYNLDALKKIAKMASMPLPKNCSRSRLMEAIEDELFAVDHIVNLSC
jgi:hypothetical protein